MAAASAAAHSAHHRAAALVPLLALLAVAGARPIPLAARTRRSSRDNNGATAAGLQTPVDLGGAALRRDDAALALAVRGGSDGMWHLNDDAPPGDRGAADAADDDAGAPDWTELMAHARCASLVYYEASTIVASHERNRYGRAARSVEWRADGSAVARWIGTKRGDATLVVREIPSVGMRYFLRTELRPGLPPVQHLAIKGSDNLQNFKDDVDYAKELCGACRVRFHRGFKRVADAVWADAEPYLLRNATLELSGHSLGGGAATIAAMRLAASGFVVKRVVSFGSPKVTNAHGCAAYAARVPLTRVLTADDPVPLLPTMDVKSHAFGFYRHFGDRLVLLDDDDRDGDGLPDDEAHGDDEADAARRRWLGERAAVLLSPTDATGEPRTKVARLGRGRYAAREDPRLAAARAAKHLDPSPWARLRDLALHQLDENFLLHAHHVSPFAHSMDAYETEVATRRVRSESLPWRAAGRRERPLKALKKRAPFLAVATVAFHRMFKWRRVIRLVRPKYLVMSFLFVGWTGGWSAGLLDKLPHAGVVEKHPLDAGDDAAPS
jgi:hypothetical protein